MGKLFTSIEFKTCDPFAEELPQRKGKKSNPKIFMPHCKVGILDVKDKKSSSKFDL